MMQWSEKGLVLDVTKLEDYISNYKGWQFEKRKKNSLKLQFIYTYVVEPQRTLYWKETTHSWEGIQMMMVFEMKNLNLMTFL